jgi:hypothetical protein
MQIFIVMAKAVASKERKHQSMYHQWRNNGNNEGVMAAAASISNG